MGTPFGQQFQQCQGSRRPSASRSTTRPEGRIPPTRMSSGRYTKLLSAPGMSVSRNPAAPGSAVLRTGGNDYCIGLFGPHALTCGRRAQHGDHTKVVQLGTPPLYALEEPLPPWQASPQCQPAAKMGTRFEQLHVVSS